ncbi:MAG: 2-aminoethylphosphonate--pyruvate transaminase [Clostridium butyricum]|nr:2-aminoethylphosphonate--pyruvate transaminase [Clostridium butyricum]
MISKNIKRNILLNPGPATTSENVKLAQIVPDICPREKEFGDVMGYISKELTKIVADSEKYTTILFGGSGTAGVEAVISSVVSNEEKILVINNGAYGKRICDICDIYNLNYIEFNSSPIKNINLTKLEKKINEVKNITHIAVIHHETTTGLLNDINSIGELCEKYSIELIVDAMSSFGGINIDMEKMNIKYLISSSNKCIQGMAGISFVICNKESLNKTQNIKPRNMYLNLYKQYEYFKKNNQMRFTPPVQVLYALKEAIKEAKIETILKREERYKECCKVLWNGLDELNLKRLVRDEDASMLLTTIIEPNIEKYNFEEFHDYLYTRGFTIYPGKLLGENTFRIANIGDISVEDMKEFVKVMNLYFKSI